MEEGDPVTTDDLMRLFIEVKATRKWLRWKEAGTPLPYRLFQEDAWMDSVCMITGTARCPGWRRHHRHGIDLSD